MEEIPDTDILIGESKVTTWEPLTEELRWVTTAGRLRQGIRELQMAWRCREDGRIRWRTIPLHLLTEEEFTAHDH